MVNKIRSKQSGRLISVMLFLLVLTLLVGVLLTHLYIKKTSRIRKIVADMPSPPSLPLVGCIFNIGTTPEDIFRYIVDTISNLGPTGVGWVGPEAFVGISSPECFETVLSNKKFNNKPFLYDWFDPYLGLISASGEKWRRKRKLLTPAFHFQILDDFIDDFNSNALILIDNLKKEVGTNGFDVHRYLGLCTLDNVAESSMGVKLNAQTEDKVPFNDAITETAYAVQTRAYSPWYYIDWIYRLSPEARIFKKNVRIVEDIIEDVISRRKKLRLEQKLLSEKEGNTEIEDSGNKKHLAFLDTLLESMENGAMFSEEELKNEVIASVIAGQHTVTEALSFILYALMKNPEVQEKAQKELDDFFGKSDRMPTAAEIHELKYLDKVIKEGLRMYPSLPLIFRTIPEDVLLPDGYTAPKGATFLISLFNLHYNPKSFPNPHVFDPERFDPEVASKRHPFAYCPFSAGPRNCIGQRFATIEMKVIVSTILRNFRIVPPIDMPDIKLSIGVVLTSSTGVNIRLVER